MQSSLWKLTALAGVVGIGSLVVLQAQRGLAPATNEEPVASAEAGDAAGNADPNALPTQPVAAFDPDSMPIREEELGVAPRPSNSLAESDAIPRRGRLTPTPVTEGDASDPFANVPAGPTPAEPFSAESPTTAESSPVEFGQESPKSRSMPRSRGLDFRDEPELAVPASRAGSTVSREPTPVDSDPFASPGGVSTADLTESNDVPVGSRIRTVGNDEPADERLPRASAEPKPRATAESVDPGPQLFGPTAAAEPRANTEPGFFGDDLPSLPAVKSRATPMPLEPMPEEAPRGEPVPASRPRDLDPELDLGAFPPLGKEPKTSEEGANEPMPVGRATPASNAVENDDPGYIRRSPMPRSRALEPVPENREPQRLPEEDQTAEPASTKPSADLDFPFDGSFPGGDSRRSTPPSRVTPIPETRRDESPESDPLRGEFPPRETPASEPEPRDVPPRSAIEPAGREPGRDSEGDLDLDRTRPRATRGFDRPSPRSRASETFPDRAADDRPRLYDPLEREPRSRTTSETATPDRSLPEQTRPERDPLERSTPERRPLERTPRDTMPAERGLPARSRNIEDVPSMRDRIDTDRSTVNVRPRGDGIVEPNSPKGPQKPQLKIEKVAPPNAVLGQPLVYHIHIRNVGDSAAQDVVVEDRIPKGSELAGTIPRAELNDTTLVWKLGTMQPGEEKKLSVRVTPISEGQIGSIATVNFVAEVASKTLITAPKLQLDLVGPKQVRTGEAVPYIFRVKNAGTADARGVVIRDIVPDGLRHPDGDDLEYDLGTLSAGATREVRLTLTAVKTGDTVNRAVASADGGVSIEASSRVEVLGPSLSITRTGPKKSYLGRPAQFTTTITNESPDVISGATVIETVPEGMEFLDSEPQGHYNPDRKTVSWRVDRLGARQEAVLKVKLRPKSAGVRTSTVRTVEPAGTTSEVSSETEVIGVANLDAGVTGLTGNLGIGDQVTFRVVVRNRGNDAATNVRLQLLIPEELEIVKSDGRGAASTDGREVTFPSISRLDAGRETAYNVTLKAVRSGNVRMTLSTDADDLTRPLTKEEQVVILQDGEASAVSTPRR